MPTVFGANRRRLELTGLEEPEELWERLREANDQVKSLSATNKKLSTRVHVLERQLSEVGGLTDDELLAELPRRVSKALESAQALGSEIVRRANEREAMILQKALTAATEVRHQSEAEAVEIRARASKDAATCIAAANAEAKRVVASAHDRRDEVLFSLRESAAELERQISVLQERRTRLAGAYDVVERTLAEARAALGREDDRSGVFSRTGSHGISSHDPHPKAVHPVPEDRRRLTALGGSVPGRHATVYDWSPAESRVG